MSRQQETTDQDIHPIFPRKGEKRTVRNQSINSVFCGKPYLCDSLKCNYQYNDEVFDTIDVMIISGDVNFESLFAEGNEEWVVAVDTSGEMHLRTGAYQQVPSNRTNNLLSR